MNMQDYNPQHFDWSCANGIATLTLNRPERKNPLTFDSYAELRDTFRRLAGADDVNVVIFTGAEGNFCSGGDVHDIIAAIAMASDMRIATPAAKTAFLFTRVGLAGCDMGACALLPRIIGQGRAAELLYTGRSMSAEEGVRWGFYNTLSSSDTLLADAGMLAERLLKGPTFAHGITKTMLRQEWNMALEQAIEAEAQAQAICMQTEDFRRAYNAFVNKERPVFEGD